MKSESDEEHERRGEQREREQRKESAQCAELAGACALLSRGSLTLSMHSTPQLRPAVTCFLLAQYSILPRNRHSINMKRKIDTASIARRNTWPPR